MSLVNLIPPTRIGSAHPRRDSRGAFGRPKTAFLEPLVPIVETKKEPTATSSSSRPCSGTIRPLSSRVYLRRTVKKGWIAKGIHEETEEDELSSNGSLDSFFDDDFDDTPQSQVLEGFLSCNTLGVQSKGNKSDWVSGDVAIPKFHCPRCRDHWYGVTAFPCDEELARLIREGKWYTGKEGNMLSQQDSEARRRNKKTDLSSSPGSYDSNLSQGIKKRKGTGLANDRSGHKIDFINPRAKTATKKNRKISFKLDGDDSGLENSGSSGLLHDGAGNRRAGRINNRGDLSRGMSLGSKTSNGLSDTDRNRNMESSSSASDINSSSSTTLLKGSGKGGKDGSGSKLGGMENNSDNMNGSGLGGKAQSKLDASRTGPFGTTGAGQGSNNNGGSSNNGGAIGRGGQLSDTRNEHDTTGGSNGLDDRHGNSRLKESMLAGQGGLNGENGATGMTNTGSSTDNHDGKGLGGKDRLKNRRGKYNSSGSLTGHSSRSSLYGGGSQRWSEDGDGNKRKERELVGGKGYMRASSPSQAEWGDPTHARAWASNTASSSRVSLAQSNKDKDEIDEVIYLPPIKNQLKNPFDSSDLPDTFHFTRAFTFSYY